MGKSVLQQLPTNRCDRRSLMETHAGLLTACITSSEEWTPAFPTEGNTAERREWVLRLHWEDLAKVAGAVAQVGYPKTSAV